jgi:hypothetical protein
MWRYIHPATAASRRGQRNCSKHSTLDVSVYLQRITDRKEMATLFNGAVCTPVPQALTSRGHPG